MAADLKALTGQAQKMDAATLVQLNALSEGWWAQAVERCEGRAKERAQRNLAESQKAGAVLNEQLDNAPECAAAHKDAATLQELARTALGERRWTDSATLFHKAEDMWDMATERCTGSQKDIANKRLEQTQTDGFNAEFCAPLFDTAREQTKKLRAGAAGLSREEKQDGLMVAETLWRDALSQCKGPAAQESARNNAQTLARERGTPWVVRRIAPAPTLAAAPVKAAPAPTSAPRPAKVQTQSVQPMGGPATLPEAAVAVSEPAVAAATSSSFSAAYAAIGNTPLQALPALSAPALQAPTPKPQPETFTEGDMRFEGQFVRDADTPTYSGKGKLRWGNGDVFEGTLQSGKRHGKGLFVWGSGMRYQGDWVQDQPNGQAVIDFPNGDHYEGAADNASPKGTGRMVYASGDSYQGQFTEGQPHGKGVYVWKNGQTFDGEWKSGRPNGQGRLRYANGDVYEGTVRDGIPNQAGTFTWVSGDHYAGEWKAGRKDGKGVFTWAGGDRWEGVYENDAQTSNGTLTRKTP